MPTPEFERADVTGLGAVAEVFGQTAREAAAGRAEFFAFLGPRRGEQHVESVMMAPSFFTTADQYGDYEIHDTSDVW